MLKKFAKNTALSLVCLIFMGLVFTFLGFLILDLLGKFSIVGLIALFGIILCVSYFIGRELYYTKGIAVASIVALPMVILVAAFALLLVAIPVVSTILQYPAAVWLEALGIRSDSLGFAFYGVAIAHYLLVALAVLVGAFKRKRA